MKATRVIAGFVFVSLGVVAAAGATGCTGTTPCTPEEHGLAGATRLTVRQLPGRAATPGACTTPRLDVIASDADLRKHYEELGIEASLDGSVDFSRERVIVREGDGNQGISWTVAQGGVGVLGLLSCGGAQAPSCVVNVIAVPATITRVETRTCDPVGCGMPVFR